MKHTIRLIQVSETSMALVSPTQDNVPPVHVNFDEMPKNVQAAWETFTEWAEGALSTHLEAPAGQEATLDMRIAQKKIELAQLAAEESDKRAAREADPSPRSE